MLDIIATIGIFLGCFLSLVGAIGLHRLPDFYTRLHALGVTDTLCSFLILFGLIIHAGIGFTAIKLLLIFLLLLFTSPTSSFALANNAWRWGLRSPLVNSVVKQKV
jgi:multicomponent Na+:H+ antiporter subunit G